MSGPDLQSICVFCGSSPGTRAEYAEAATQLGRELAGRGIQLVYGGGKVGLMGTVADAVLAAGGRVIGVIPHALLAREVGHAGLTELRVVNSMHERKAMMAELADAFIALPGGMGTLEEICEVLTWAQLGLHRKPCGLLDVCEYYAPLREFFRQAVTDGFVREEHAAMLMSARKPADLLAKFAAYAPPDVPKWIGRKET